MLRLSQASATTLATAALNELRLGPAHGLTWESYELAQDLKAGGIPTHSRRRFEKSRRRVLVAALLALGPLCGVRGLLAQSVPATSDAASTPHQATQPRPATSGKASPKTTVPAASAIQFENVISQSKIKFKLRNSVSPHRYTFETMVGGVAVFDYNNDGLLDIFFTNGAAIPSLEKSDPSYANRLFRNNGDGTFTDVTEKAGLRGIGYSMGVAAGDYDNDGFVDLYVTGVNRNQLFHNDGDGTFTDVTEKAGVGGFVPKLGKAWSVAAGWFDYNNDGLLDLFVVELPQLQHQNCDSLRSARTSGLLFAGRFSGNAEHPVSQQWRRHVYRRLRTVPHFPVRWQRDGSGVCRL